MKFTDFTELMSKVKKLPLEGIKAHQEMAPIGRKVDYDEKSINERNPLHAAVTAMFYPSPTQETMLILILRNTYPGVHSGQMGFPGGRVEVRDEDLKDTALRETYEEVGILPSNVHVIREMTATYIPPSNFWVHPFLAYAKTTPKFKRQESEVEQLVPVKLEELMNEENIITETLNTSYGEFVDVPAFALNGKIVWGATAMMLNEVKSLFKEVL